VAPGRCVIVADKDLSIGQAANVAAVVALTIGQRHPVLVGEPFVDGSAFAHPGLIPIGITVLSALENDLSEIRRKGLEAKCDVVDFPREGQQTRNYQAFREATATVNRQAMRYLAVALVRRKKEISKIVGHLALLRWLFEAYFTCPPMIRARNRVIH
jgi:hypothetical protein